MVHFKQQTAGAPVVMGRKTWDSLPPRFRPLPGRHNIVISRQDDWRAEGAHRVGSLQEALALCEESQVPDVWIIGGARFLQVVDTTPQSIVDAATALTGDGAPATVIIGRE